MISDETKRNLRELSLDEWLIQELSDDDVRFIFELTEKLYDCHSTLYTVQSIRLAYSPRWEHNG